MNPLAILTPGAFRDELLAFAHAYAKKEDDGFPAKVTRRSTMSAVIKTLEVEFVIMWLVLVDNASAGIILPCATYIGIASFLVSNGDMSIVGFTQGLVVTFLYFFFYLYLFDLCNQLLSLDEDTVNKPHRPMPSGLLSRHSAQQRIGPVICMWLLMAFYLRVQYITLTWIVISLMYGKLGSHWFGKNFVMIPAGALHIKVVAWLIVGVSWTDIPMTRFMLQILLTTLTVNMQDLKDVEGDIKLGRQTMPIVFGKNTTRWLHAVVTVVVFPVVYFEVFPGPIGILKCVTILLTIIYGGLLACFQDNRSARIAYDVYVLSHYFIYASEAWYVGDE